MSSRKILVIDDDAAVNTAVRLTLEDKYDVATTTSAFSAFKYISVHAVDLVLLDIRMPVMNGIEALKYIKKRCPETIVVMLTAYSTVQNINAARKEGAHGIIIKPFDVMKLREYVDTALGQSIIE